MSHPDIVNCSAIAAPHPLWGERPILIVIPVKDIKPKKTTIIDLLKTQFSKWQIPEDILFVDQLPLTATGKVSKLTLRNEYKTYFLEQETET
jgi:fatty-acyl-CoA synthase